MTLASDHRPTLIIVSGRPGSGKTTLAHILAKTLSCPLISRDEIYEGIFHTFADRPEPADKEQITKSAFDSFFGVIGVLLSSRVTFVAEAAFQDERWRLGLEPYAHLGDMKLIHCSLSPELAHQRTVQRRLESQQLTYLSPARAYPKVELSQSVVRSFEEPTLPVPSLHVDTSDGYDPTLDDIVKFAISR